MDATFCPRCGRRLVTRLVEGRERPVCLRDEGGCGFIDWGRYTQVVRAILLQRDDHGRTQVLLVDLGDGYWWLPGGHVDSTETAEAAVVREIREEVSLEVAVEGLVGFRSRRSGTGDLSTLFFLVRRLGGEFYSGLSEEHREARFFAFEDLRSIRLLPIIEPLVLAARTDRLRVFRGTPLVGVASSAAGEQVPPSTLFMGLPLDGQADEAPKEEERDRRP